MAASAQEKTEKPTGKRLGDARRKGNVAKSQDLNAVFVLLAGGFTTYLSAGRIHEQFGIIITRLWSEGFRISSGYTPDTTLFMDLMIRFLWMIFPTISVCMITAVSFNLFQLRGFLVSFEAIKPKFSKLNPLPGFARFFNLHSLVELAKSIIKLLVIGYTMYVVIRSEQDLIVHLITSEVRDIVQSIGHLCVRVLYRVGGIMLLVGLLDYAFQKWKYIQDLKMTKQEVKEEAKQAENPEIKSRIRSVQFQMHRMRMMANVPKASVVITNPTHYAVALQYEAGMEAPKVVAKGADHLALKIIEVAREHKVPTVQNPPLARALYKQVELDETIPAGLYKAVAKVLAYIYQQKRQRA